MIQAASSGSARMTPAICLAMSIALALPCPLAGAIEVPDGSPPTPNEAFADLTGRVNGLAARLQQLHQRHEALRARVEAIPETSRKDMIKDLKKTQQLARALTRLESLYAPLAKTRGSATSIAELKKAAADALSKRDELVRKQAEAGAGTPPESEGFGLPVAIPKGKMKPIALKLVKNRVVPLTNEYFTSRADQARLPSGEVVNVRVIARVRDGETLADALRKGGLVDKLLSKAKTKDNYVLMLVCVDSIAAYRQLAMHVAKRGYAYSWDTSKDTDVILRVGDSPGEDSNLSAVDVYR